MQEALTSSTSGDIEGLEVLVGEEDWSSTNSLFPSDVEALFALVECAICVGFLSDARECTACHALFCSGCLDTWLASTSSCPCCRGGDGFVPNVLIQRFVDALSTECPHPGCAARPCRAELAAHTAACPFSPARVQSQRTEHRRALEARALAVASDATPSVDDLVSLVADFLSANDGAAALTWGERACAKHSEDARCQEALGDALFATGNWQRALAFYEGAHEPRKTAQCLVELGRYDDAERSLLSAKGGHGDDFAILCSLGALKKKQSAYGEARRHLEEALRLVPFGGKPWIEASIVLADTLRKTEQYEESKRLYVKVLKRSEVEFGKRSSAVATALNALGILCKKLGQYANSKKYLKASWGGHESVSVSFLLSDILPSRFHLKAAIKLKVALSRGEYNHAEVGAYMSNLGDVFRKESSYPQAEALYGRALTILEATVGAEHIEVADVLNSLGLVKKKFALYDDAARLYDRALAICAATFKGKPHYKTGIYMNNRADVERKRGNYDAALSMYAEALQLLRSTVGPSHSECADPLHASGLVHHQLGHFGEAVESISAALSIVEREFSSAHYKYGVYLSSRGLAKAMLNDIDGAYADLKRSLQTLIHALGPTHIEVADVYSALADVCLKLFAEGARDAARLAEAKKNVEAARAIIVPKFGEHHTKTQQCDSLLFICENFHSM